MTFDRKKLTHEQLLSFLKALLLPRLIEEKMFLLLRQGKISKWFSAYGQEAISVGATLALKDSDFILPMHRNLGMFTTRGIELDRLFAQFQGKKEGFTKGRDRSFHFGSTDHHLVGMISHLGPQMGVADGIALGAKLKQSDQVTLVVTGDGGASEGDFHEALNLASVWQLPVIFLVENNHWGLSTPSKEQFNFPSFTLKGPGYGIDAAQVDGNNLLEVYHKVDEIAQSIRSKPRPYLLECHTFRVRGHEEASGTKYYPDGLIDFWKSKDPIDNYVNFLLDEEIMNSRQVEMLKADLIHQIDSALKTSKSYELPQPSTAEEVRDMYYPFEPVTSYVQAGAAKVKKRFVDAISDALEQSLDKYDHLIIMGQDIAEYGGVFKVTEGLAEKFGKDRIRNTPICESAVIGAALGLSIQGFKSIVEMQFADFVSSGFNQIVNNLAKVHYRWGQPADVVIRMPTGAGVGAGPFHSQSNEAWFFHTPGLKIVYPSNPHDAKGLLNAAIEDNNPYLYLEHKALYRSISEEIPEEYYTTTVGEGKLISTGEDLSIITYGMGVYWALEILNSLPEIKADLIDLRSLIPWDKALVEQTVKKTGKVIICHEDTLTGGIGGEIAAWIGEHLFEYLDAPIMREASLDTPVPFSSNLEENFLPKERIREKIIALSEY